MGFWVGLPGRLASTGLFETCFYRLSFGAQVGWSRPTSAPGRTEGLC
jgi:hypothetical protein